MVSMFGKFAILFDVAVVDGCDGDTMQHLIHIFLNNIIHSLLDGSIQ
jgi:hypothetical protein